MFSRISNLERKIKVSPIQLTAKSYFSGAFKSKKRCAKAFDALVLFLAENKLSLTEYDIILRIVRSQKVRNVHWKKFYLKLKPHAKKVPKWFFQIVEGFYNQKLMYEAQYDALQERWNNGTKEKYYWSKYDEYRKNSIALFKSAWRENPSCPEAAFGMLIGCDLEFSKDYTYHDSDISSYFNMSVQAQADFAPAYYWIIQRFRSKDYGETMMMASAEKILKSNLYFTNVPDMYLYSLIESASDWRFAWQATFQYERVYENLKYYFKKKLQNDLSSNDKNLILSRKLQMYRLCKKYSELTEILAQIPIYYDLSKVYDDLIIGSDFSIIRADRDEIIAEIAAYSGKSAELLRLADKAIINGLGESEIKILQNTLKSESDIVARGYIAKRLAMRQTSRSLEYDIPPQDLAGYFAANLKFAQLELLCRNGEDRLDRILTKGRTPLTKLMVKKNSKASDEDIIRMIDMLVKYGANINAKDKFGGSPFFYASAKKSSKVCNHLLKLKADPNNINNIGTTPIIYVCKKNLYKKAEFLTKIKGVNLEAIDKRHFNALGYAVKNANIELVKCLLKNGAKAQPESKGVWHPLLLAVIENNIEIVKILLAAGADPNAKSLCNKTAFTYLKPKQKEISKLFAKYKKTMR